MTRKDYVLIAEALARPIKPVIGHEHAMKIAWEEACANVADALAKDNPRFDRARFLRACGVQL